LCCSPWFTIFISVSISLNFLLSWSTIVELRYYLLIFIFLMNLSNTSSLIYFSLLINILLMFLISLFHAKYIYRTDEANNTDT
jgi:hypothetical protein